MVARSGAALLIASASLCCGQRCWIGHEQPLCTGCAAGPPADRDLGPWLCLDDGCASPVLDCTSLRASCAAFFGDLNGSLPVAPATLVADACPNTCAPLACEASLQEEVASLLRAIGEYEASIRDDALIGPDHTVTIPTHPRAHSLSVYC